MGHRFSIEAITAALMMADNWGDVHDEINHLHDYLGLDRPEGNRDEGWTKEDFDRLGQ